MRILVVGASGMLGHRVLRRLSSEFETWGTARGGANAKLTEITGARLITGVIAEAADTLVRAFRIARPDAVINCAGVTNHTLAPEDMGSAIAANALLPHHLADLCEAAGSHLLQVSTDCVFSGEKGNYREDDPPDPRDLYGFMKVLGEVARPGCLTIRTSIIGWELIGRRGLGEWFASCRGQPVRGFRRVVFSGLTTAALSDLFATLLKQDSIPNGLFHVSAEPIDKYSCLVQLDAALGWGTVINAVDEPTWDRSLNSGSFRRSTGWTPPSWSEMLTSLAAERPQYERWRSQR